MANTVYYVDPQNGVDTNNGTTESTPKATIPAVAVGDTVRMRRGSVYDKETTSILQSNRQGLTITDYGPESAPKPVFRLKAAAGTYGFLCQGDTLFNNIAFHDFRITDTEVVGDPIGPHAINFNRRNGTAGQPGVSGAVINCDFKNIGANAIMANQSADGLSPLLASPYIIILGCRFDGIGADGFFGAAQNLRLGHCEFRRMGTRKDASYTPPAGGWQSTSDCIGAYNGGGFWHIHDCWMDHRDFDCKQAIGISGSADTNPHTNLIERNVILGHEDAYSCTPVNILADFTFRNNYVRGSRILLNIHNDSNMAKVQSNIFHHLRSRGGVSAIECFGTGTELLGNTIIGDGVSPWAVRKRTGASGFIARQNMIKGFAKGIYLAPDTTDYIVGDNGWFDVASRYEDTAPIATPSTDVVFPTDPFIPGGYELKRTMAVLDGSAKHQMRDFFSRFPGIAHIGALASQL